MFKKGCPINQRSLQSGADRKKIRRGMEKAFDLLEEDGLDQVLPNKAGEMEIAKVGGVNGSPLAQASPSIQ
jgi:hypothetical protein